MFQKTFKNIQSKNEMCLLIGCNESLLDVMIKSLLDVMIKLFLLVHKSPYKLTNAFLSN